MYDKQRQTQALGTSGFPGGAMLRFPVFPSMLVPCTMMPRGRAEEDQDATQDGPEEVEAHAESARSHLLYNTVMYYPCGHTCAGIHGRMQR